MGYFTGSQEIFLQNLYFGRVVINGSPYEKIKNFANYPPLTIRDGRVRGLYTNVTDRYLSYVRRVVVGCAHAFTLESKCLHRVYTGGFPLIWIQQGRKYKEKRCKRNQVSFLQSHVIFKVGLH